MTTSEQAALAIAVGALRPYLSQLVIVGGWAHRLFRLRASSDVPSFAPLLTDDADIAAPLHLQNRERPIDELLKAVGFVEELRGEDVPPVASYILATDETDFELEFIAQRRGRRTRRNGTRDVTVNLGGIVAQKLPYVDALLFEPWTVELGPNDGYPVPDGPVTVQIANPTCYLFQKLMVLPARIASGKGGKDALYMFDTLKLFSSSLLDLRAIGSRLAAAATKEDRATFADLRARFFGGTSGVLIDASMEARASGRAQPPDSVTIAETCRYGFTQIFG